MANSHPLFYFSKNVLWLFTNNSLHCVFLSTIWCKSLRCSFQRRPQPSACLHLTPSSAFFLLTPTNLMSSFTASINLFVLPPSLLDESLNLNILLLIYSMSLFHVHSKSSQSGLSGFVFQISVPDLLIPYPSLSKRSSGYCTSILQLLLNQFFIIDKKNRNIS